MNGIVSAHRLLGLMVRHDVRTAAPPSRHLPAAAAARTTLRATGVFAPAATAPWIADHRIYHAAPREIRRNISRDGAITSPRQTEHPSNIGVAFSCAWLFARCRTIWLRVHRTPLPALYKLRLPVAALDGDNRVCRSRDRIFCIAGTRDVFRGHQHNASTPRFRDGITMGC